MLSLSKSKGTGGTVKKAPEDFIVREITRKGIALELRKRCTAKDIGEEETAGVKFCTIVLEKRNWNTIAALLAISKKLGHGRKAIGYSGIKDRQAVTVQLASVFGAEPSAALGIHVKDISINGAWRSNGIEMGSNIGNAFSARIRNYESAGAGDKVENIVGELSGRVPNYFDAQRFGSRLNNAYIGICIMEGRFEDAAMEFLAGTGNETSEDATLARNKLREEQDFKEALEYFPRYLKTERTVIGALAREKNYANALRSIPRGISLLFIHAVESYVFNAELEARIRDDDFSSKVCIGSSTFGFPDPSKLSETGFPCAPLIGYKTDERAISSYSEEAMQKLGITKESFMLKGMPELSMKGDIRALLAPFKDFSYSVEEETVTANFSLPAGSYATIFLNEIMKNSPMGLSSIKTKLEQSRQAP